jgi:NAD(P)-dependent dehydrogenase (short-subunit alcohol dehydrogenase family)
MSNYCIIGASSGIGLSTAQKLIQAGHQVFSTYFNNKKDLDLSISNFHYLNVLDENLNFDFLPEILDGLIYCPGSINLRPFERIKPSDFVTDYELQVVGAIKVIQVLLPRLKRSEIASIVLFSTLAVQTGLPYHAQVSASKGAIEGLTKALAAEYAPKIRVNCIAPSLTDTPLAQSLLNTEQKREANALRHPLKRIGTPEDIANLAEFLISEKSCWITGQIHHIDGGLSALKV